MDNNNLNPQTPVVNTTPPQPIQPTVPQAPIPSPSGDSSKMILMFVIGLIVIVIVVGGIYLFLGKQPATTTQPTVQTTPKPEDTVDALTKDLDSVNVGGTNSDFTSVDKDIQSL